MSDVYVYIGPTTRFVPGLPKRISRFEAEETDRIDLLEECVAAGLYEAESGARPATRSEVINALGETAGRRFIDAGYSTGSAIARASDEELLEIPDVGPATLSEAREAFGSQEANN